MTMPTPRPMPADEQLADIDRRIAQAARDVHLARAACWHSCNADTMDRLSKAIAHRDSLLEERYAIQPHRPSWRG